MDFLNWFVTNMHMDLITMLLVFSSGFAQARYFPQSVFHIVKDSKYDSTLKTFFLSLIVVGIYIVLVHKQDKGIPIPWVIYFISYFTATSLYELLIKPFTKWINKITGNTEPDSSSLN